mmetsp:Transcript_119986/g.339501  ORF Transcript_119986/g.339501 Transcript_119986/m.339501 type:complete len:236 (+) Transcript_119986:1732-2439(+)
MRTSPSVAAMAPTQGPQGAAAFTRDHSRPAPVLRQTSARALPPLPEPPKSQTSPSAPTVAAKSARGSHAAAEFTRCQPAGSKGCFWCPTTADQTSPTTLPFESLPPSTKSRSPSASSPTGSGPNTKAWKPARAAHAAEGSCFHSSTISSPAPPTVLDERARSAHQTSLLYKFRIPAGAGVVPSSELCIPPNTSNASPPRSTEAPKNARGPQGAAFEASAHVAPRSSLVHTSPKRP